VSRRARLAIFAPALVGFAALLVWGVAGLPHFGHYRGPYGHVVNRIVIPERHVSNAVNATTYDIRGFDTMGEEFILFAAVTGVVLLLRGSGRTRAEKDDVVRSDVVRAAGAVTPGGGFQGGVAVAGGAAVLFVTLGYRAWSRLGNESILDPLEGLGAGGYVVVGVAALASGLPFLTNIFGFGVAGTLRSGGSAELLNWAAAIEVAAANLILMTEFVEQYLVRGRS